MNNLLKIIIVCAVAIGVLYWTIANPNSARGVKNSIDTVANTCSETVDKFVDSLTD